MNKEYSQYMEGSPGAMSATAQRAFREGSLVEKRTTPQQELENLHGVITELEGKVRSLEERLAPVCIPEPPAQEGSMPGLVSPGRPMGEIRRVITAAQERVSLLNNRLNYLLSRIEL